MVALHTTPHRTAPPTDRRRALRFRPAYNTYCSCSSGGEGLVWDMSATGLGMLTARPLAVGDVVQTELTTDRTSLLISARVAHTRPLAGGDYFIGLRFVRPLAGHELEMFVTPGNVFAAGVSH